MYSLEIVSRRARLYRKLAFSFVAFVVLIIAALSAFLLTYTNTTTHTWEELMPNVYISPLDINEKEIPEEIHSEIRNVKGSIGLLETKFKEFVDFKTSTYFDLIFIGITRIGAILLILYLVKLIVSFTRYLFRVADHYDYVADIMYLSENNDSIPKDKLIELMSPKHIVFDGMPSDFQDKTMDILKELVAKK
ncbi:hypothetical protein [Marinobacterium sp. BA1]|uniref:hypothetical protein n=1 Tax=Marinobacterium sp. BA1 TaxID=3138931 RepID=UPI0032E6F6E1